MFGVGLDIAIGVLLALVFCHYIGLTKKAAKAFSWLAAGGVSFILAGVFELVFTPTGLLSDFVDVGTYGSGLFSVIGWILVLIGSLWAMYQLLVE